MRRRNTHPDRGIGEYVPADVPALLRYGQATQPAPRPLTDAGILRKLSQEHQDAFRAGGFRNPLFKGAGADAPWVSPPDSAQPFEDVRSVATPAAGSTVTVITLPVPYGYDGVVRRASHNYTGGGFVQGSGDLIWRLLIDGAAVRNFEALAVEFGTVERPREIDSIRIRSGQTLAYVVEHSGASALAVAGTFIICSLGGWFYPTGE